MRRSVELLCQIKTRPLRSSHSFHQRVPMDERAQIVLRVPGLLFQAAFQRKPDAFLPAKKLHPWLLSKTFLSNPHHQKHQVPDNRTQHPLQPRNAKIHYRTIKPPNQINKSLNIWLCRSGLWALFSPQYGRRRGYWDVWVGGWKGVALDSGDGLYGVSRG